MSQPKRSAISSASSGCSDSTHARRTTPPTAALAEQIHTRIKRESERGTEILLSVIESADANPPVVIAQPYGISGVPYLLRSPTDREIL